MLPTSSGSSVNKHISNPSLQSMEAPKNLKKYDDRNNELTINANISVFADSYAQKYPKSCAAACLFFIARNITLQKTPLLAEALNKFPPLSDAYPYFDENLSLRFCYEKDIYKITGAFSDNTSDMNLPHLSLPQHIVSAAELLGLKAEVYFPDNTLTATMMKFPALVEIITETKAAIAVKDSAAPGLREDEFEMKLCLWIDLSVDIKQLKFSPHWIICRPDNTIMEPSLGWNFKSLEAFNSFCAFRLLDTGVSIILKDSGITPHILPSLEQVNNIFA